MNILSLFPAIPLIMMLGLWVSRNTRQIHAVMVTGASALLVLAVWLVLHYLGLRTGGADAEMLLTDSFMWYAPLNIHYSVGVDGISVAMLLLSAIIVFTFRFMADEDGCQRVLHVVLPPERRGIRFLHLDRPVHHVHVLRSGAHPDVSSHRRMGKRAQGIFGHEADTDAHGRLGTASDRYPRDLLRLRSNYHEHSGNSTDAQYTDESPAHLVPDNLHRIRSARSSRSIHGARTDMLQPLPQYQCCMPGY